MEKTRGSDRLANPASRVGARPLSAGRASTAAVE